MGDLGPHPQVPSDRHIMFRRCGVAREKASITPDGVTDFGETATIIQDFGGNPWNTNE